MPSVADVCADLDRFAPLTLAADWDNVGLLLGDRHAAADRILTCLTLTANVVDEAIASGVQMIVTHHPILFRGSKRLSRDTAEGRIVWDLARAGIAVYSPHTAFDNTINGINDALARRLGLTNVRPLRPGRLNATCKLVVFVPDTDLARVSDALFQSGAGVIGQYRECSYRLAGMGTFYGSDAADPAIGERGRREEVAEWRLEVVCPERDLNRAVTAMRQAHSYEEPAYDIYPLKAASTATQGEGRIGRLATPLALSTFAGRARSVLNAGPVAYSGAGDRPITTVAIACGAAGEFLSDAAQSGADLFVTGELRFHDLLAAESKGLAVALLGHYASERFAVEELAKRLANVFPSATVTASAREHDPLTWA